LLTTTTIFDDQRYAVETGRFKGRKVTVWFTVDRRTCCYPVNGENLAGNVISTRRPTSRFASDNEPTGPTCLKKKKRRECENSSNPWKHRGRLTGDVPKTDRSTFWNKWRVGEKHSTPINDLRFKPYTIRIVRSLNPGDCRRFREENDEHVNDLWMNDEQRLSGFVNKRHFRHWTETDFRLFRRLFIPTMSMVRDFDKWSSLFYERDR